MLSKCSLSIFIHTYILFKAYFSICHLSAGSLLGVCWESAGSLLGVCWESAGSQLGVCWELAGSWLGVSWELAGSRLGVGWEPAGGHSGVSQKPTRLCSPLALHELSIFPWYFQLVSWSCLGPFDMPFNCFFC